MREENEDEIRRKKLMRDKKDKSKQKGSHWEDRRPPRGRIEDYNEDLLEEEY